MPPPTELFCIAIYKAAPSPIVLSLASRKIGLTGHIETGKALNGKNLTPNPGNDPG